MPIQLPHPRCFALAVMLFAGACRAPQQAREGDTPPNIPIPDAWFAEQGDALAQSQLAGWWNTFDDPQLTALVERVLMHNTDLRASASRLQAAQAQARIAGAALYPSVLARGDAGRQRQNFVGLPIPGSDNRVLTSTTSNYGVSLDVTWELDLWGKLDARDRAADASFRASEADFVAAQLSLAGQAAKTWFALTEAKLQRDNTARTVQSYEQSAQILRGRFAQRGVAALDLRLAESQLATGRALLAAYEEQVRRVVRQLEFLAGDYPAGELECEGQFPVLPAELPSVLPGELLQRRPDLVSAERRMAQADLQLYAARKDLYPSLSLTTNIGRRSSDVGDLNDPDFDVWGWVGNISAPLFQGGRLSAQIDFEQASVQAALYDWARDLLNAYLEVETALSADGPLRRREEQLGLAAEHADAARRLAEERYLLGRNDIIAVLDARQRAFTNRSAQLTAQRELLDLRVDLFLALGGGFGEDSPPSSGNETEAAAAPVTPTSSDQ